MATDWNLVHPQYRKNWWQWRFTELAYIGGKDYMAPDIPSEWSYPRRVTGENGETALAEAKTTVYSFLRRHDREESWDYAQRLAASYYRNFIRPVVDIRKAHLLSKPIERADDGVPMLEQFWENVDLRGNDITSFMGEGLVSAQLFGHVFAVVDMPQVMPGEIRSLADAAEAQLRPFATWYSPLAVADWQVDRFGRLLWIKLAEADTRTVRVSAGDAVAPAKINWRIWYQDHWELREGPSGANVYDKGGEVGALIAEGPNPTGRVPVEVLYYKRHAGECDPVGWTDVYDMAQSNREIYNLDSGRQDLLENQAFAFLVVPDKSGRVSQVDVGIRRAFVADPEAGTPQYVGPPTDYITVNKEEVADLILQIRAMAGLSRGVAESSIAARSGDALLLETSDKSAILCSYAHEAEDFEQRLASLACAWTGQEFNGHIRYPDDYNARTLMDDLDEALKVKDLELPKTAMAYVQEGILRKILKHIDPSELTTLVDELHAEAEEPDPTPPPMFGQPSDTGIPTEDDETNGIVVKKEKPEEENEGAY